MNLFNDGAFAVDQLPLKIFFPDILDVFQPLGKPVLLNKTQIKHLEVLHGVRCLICRRVELAAGELYAFITKRNPALFKARIGFTIPADHRALPF